MNVLIHSDIRIKGTKRAWELQKRRTHEGGQTWETYRWFTSFSSALEDVVHSEIRTHPAATLSEAIEAVSVIVQRYEQLIPSEYRISK